MPLLSGHSGSAKRSVFASLVVLALSITALGVAFTGAIFTDTQSVGGSSFSTGSVDISTSPTSALLSAAGLAPGARAESSITVTNAGSLQLRYAIQRSATNPDTLGLRGELKLRIAARGGLTCDFPYYGVDGSTNLLLDDVQVYEGTGFPGSSTNTVGDATQGFQLGDRILAGGASEALCFSVILPSGVGNAVQDATTTATFDFVAEQTANN